MSSQWWRNQLFKTGNTTHKVNQMKSLITALAFVIGLSFSTMAQLTTTMPLKAGDTIVNTGTVNKAFSSSSGFSAAGIQIVITKISGTVAGTTKLQGSVNGTNWEDIGSAFTHTDVASQAKLFTVTGGVPYTQLRTTSVGSGTMSAQVRVSYVLKLHSR
jgi:hypothetical protein